MIPELKYAEAGGKYYTVGSVIPVRSEVFGKNYHLNFIIQLIYLREGGFYLMIFK